MSFLYSILSDLVSVQYGIVLLINFVYVTISKVINELFCSPLLYQDYCSQKNQLFSHTGLANAQTGGFKINMVCDNFISPDYCKQVERKLINTQVLTVEEKLELTTLPKLHNNHIITNS